MIGAETVPLLDQGSVQFILFGVMVLAVVRPAVDHHRQVARRSAAATSATARPRRFTSASVAFRCS